MMILPGTAREKVSFDPHKETWHPSVLPGHIVLVSTVNEHGEPNLAPKSWITMVAVAGPVIAFGCNTEHATYRNIAATGAFVVNVPGEPLADTIWSLIRHHGAERLRRAGLTLRPARQVQPPLVEECHAHLECEVDSFKFYGPEVLIFGKVVAASIDAACADGASPDPYFALRPIFFLEDGTYGSIDASKRVGRECPAAQPLFVVEVGEVPSGRSAELADRHLAFLRELRAEGSLALAGPFEDEPGASDRDDRPGGLPMYLISAPQRAEADAVARRDPLVRAGARYTVRAWTRTF